jgi:hypothetical protein
MDLTSNITLGIFIGFIILSRYINNQAIKKLSTQKKAELLDGFGNFSVWAVVPLFLMMGGFYFAIDYIENNFVLYLSLFFLIIGIYVVGIQVYIYKKLKKMDYPISYIKQYILSVLVRFLGLFVLLYPIALTALTLEKH